MNDHHHEGCPHGHEGELCSYGVTDVGGDVVSTETAEVIADASVEIAGIEAETERLRIAAELEHHEMLAATESEQIDASLEHHEMLAATESEQIDASLEHHEIEAAVADDVEEAVEELAEVVEDLADELAPAGHVEPDGDEGGIAGDATEVTPPPRVVAPRAPTKAKRQSKFTKRHSRRR